MNSNAPTFEGRGAPTDGAEPSRTAVVAAYAAAALFLLAFSRFFLLSPEGEGNVLVALLGAVPHLLLFPVVAALPAPGWGRAAGYGWLVVDIATDVMALNGVPALTFLPMRYGGHVAAALWIASSSWRAKGATRAVGLLLALNLGGYSFVAPFDPTHFAGLLPVVLLLQLWLVLAGRLIVRTAKHGRRVGVGDGN